MPKTLILDNINTSNFPGVDRGYYIHFQGESYSQGHAISILRERGFHLYEKPDTTSTSFPKPFEIVSVEEDAIEPDRIDSTLHTKVLQMARKKIAFSRNNGVELGFDDRTEYAHVES